ncbi:MAG: hypothetical protein ACOYL6_16680 [Bacteriovoracaceae bacterium]
MKNLFIVLLALTSISAMAGNCITDFPTQRNVFGVFDESKIVEYKFTCSIKKDILVKPSILNKKVAFPFSATWDSYSVLTDQIAIGTDKLAYVFQFAGSTTYDMDSENLGYTPLTYLVKKIENGKQTKLVGSWTEVKFKAYDTDRALFNVDGVEVRCYRMLQCKN